MTDKTQCAQPAQTPEADLIAYGYAPGDYMIRCHKCNATFAGADKRAITCRACAEKMYAAALAARPAIPAPDPARAVIEQCRDALAEELGAWDIDPPLHHVKTAHDACVAWLEQAAIPAPEGAQACDCPNIGACDGSCAPYVGKRDDPHDPMLAEAWEMAKRLEPAAAEMMRKLCKRMREDDRMLSQTIDEREERQQFIDDLLDALHGPDRHEWTSAYGFNDAMEDALERLAALEAAAPSPAEGDATRRGLLPCPFCGSRPVLTVRPDNAEATSYFAAVACFCGGYAACAHKDATASEADEAERLAREKWNGRAAHPQPKGTDLKAQALSLCHALEEQPGSQYQTAAVLAAFKVYRAFESIEKHGEIRQWVFDVAAPPAMPAHKAEELAAFEEWRNTLHAANLDGKRDLVWRHIAGAGFEAGAAWARSQAPAPAHGRWVSADDVDRLARELDVALNGDAAAPQAKLCDIVAEVQRTRRQRLTPEWAYELIGRHASNRLLNAFTQPNEARDRPEVCPDVVAFMDAIMRTAGAQAPEAWADDAALTEAYANGRADEAAEQKTRQGTTMTTVPNSTRGFDHVAETPATLAPKLNLIDLIDAAQHIVRGKTVWKRFIDGTPLSNDISVWMAEFARDVVEQQMQAPAVAHAPELGNETVTRIITSVWPLSAKRPPSIGKIKLFASLIEAEVRAKLGVSDVPVQTMGDTNG